MAWQGNAQHFVPMLALLVLNLSDTEAPRTSTERPTARRAGNGQSGDLVKLQVGYERVDRLSLGVRGCGETSPT